MNKIAIHEDIFRVPPLVHLNHYWTDRQGGRPLPDVRGAKGFVDAYINHGRWIAECPPKLTPAIDRNGELIFDKNGGQVFEKHSCGHALVASDAFPYYICTVCGNEENDGQFYNIRFPSNRAAIEAELVKRPVRNPIHSKPWAEPTRNWIPGESVAKLRAEAAERGIR